MNGENPIRTLVAVLLQSCRPIAIFRTIVSIIVDSVKGFTGRSWGHVFHKKFRAMPSLAHPYSSTAIVLVLSIIGIVASSFHVLPNKPQPINGPGSGASMFKKCSVINLLSRASTGSCVACGEVRTSDFFYRSAFALTKNISDGISRFCSSSFCLGNNFILSKLLSYDIPFNGHSIYVFNVVLSGGCLAATSTRCAIFSKFNKGVN